MGDTLGTGYRALVAAPTRECIEGALASLPGVTVERRFADRWGRAPDRSHHVGWLYRLAGRKVSLSVLSGPSGISYSNTRWSRQPIPETERLFLLPLMQIVDARLERACGLAPPSQSVGGGPISATVTFERTA